MTEEQQRIAIAEACGWKWFTVVAEMEYGGRVPVPLKQRRKFLAKPECIHQGIEPAPDDMQKREFWASGVPNHLNDLNAMHEAERIVYQTQSADWAGRYNQALCDVADRATDTLEYNWEWHATAAQRAEAFLRTIGKWAEVAE